MTRETNVSLVPSPQAAEDVAALNERAWLLQYGNPLEARALAKRALDLSRAGGDERSAAYARITLACYEMRHGDRDVADQEAHEIRQYFADQHDLRGQMRASFCLAARLIRNGQPELAYAEIIGYLPELDRADPVDAFSMYNSLGICCCESGMMDDGMRHLYRALGSARELGCNDHLTLILSNLGATQHDAGNYEDAIRFLVEAYERLVTAGVESLAPLVASNLAMCQLAIGAHQAAYDTIQPHMSMDDESVHIGTADSAFFKAIAAHTYTVRQEWDVARKLIEQALEGAERSGDIRVETHCHWVHGLIERGEGHLGESLAALQRAAKNLPRLKDPYYPVQIYRELSRAHAELAQWREAYECLEEFQDIFQRSQGSAARARTQILQIQNELDDAERERDFALMKQAEAERARSELESLNHELAIKVDEIQRLQTKLRDQAIRDPLTDLYNRRYLQEELGNEIRLAERRYYPVTVVLIDIDHFKQVNDRYGHPVGDRVLVELAELMRGNIRGSDFACRYGGEEFCLVLSDIGVDRATQRIQDLLDRFHALVVNVGGKKLKNLTFSAGVAEYPRHGRSGEALLKAADVALYNAKAAGRDRIFEAEEA
ncbi:MAG: diguanylate cyclase [Burkholderiales bacterium]|nr:diguanylate cyclase [Burkholderiales bacterium]